MEIEPEDFGEGKVRVGSLEGNIQFDGVSFAYEKKGESDEKPLNKLIIDNMDLKIPKGHTIALVGPSGGGKTTLCNLIPRFYEIDSGRILIDGIDIKDMALTDLRRNIGIVQQDVFLYGGTVKENIAYGNFDASEDDIIAAAKLANIHDYVMSLPEGYDTYVGERGVKLSGGQKQRVSIARAFLKNPPILILDEATSALDNATEMLIQESLEKLSEGRTTIVVAHRLSTIKNADEIIVITGSGVAERGTHNELLEKGTQVSYEEVLLDMQKRDLNDSTRAFAPLKQADDAVLIDTTEYDFDESVNKILSYIKENMK
jgi:ATP-binding cassette subfamily B protein